MVRVIQTNSIRHQFLRPMLQVLVVVQQDLLHVLILVQRVLLLVLWEKQLIHNLVKHQLVMSQDRVEVWER